VTNITTREYTNKKDLKNLLSRLSKVYEELSLFLSLIMSPSITPKKGINVWLEAQQANKEFLELIDELRDVIFLREKSVEYSLLFMDNLTNAIDNLSMEYVKNTLANTTSKFIYFLKLNISKYDKLDKKKNIIEALTKLPEKAKFRIEFLFKVFGIDKGETNLLKDFFTHLLQGELDEADETLKNIEQNLEKMIHENKSR
jgi:hypothetical protein